MKIRKDSWHYRLLKWSFPNDKLVGFARKGIRYETAEEMKEATGFGPFHTEIGESLPKMSLCRYCNELILTICIGLPILSMMVILTSPLFIACYVGEWWDIRKSKQPVKSKAPKLSREPRTLLGKWLKAKKDKVCPILEYE
jgi:hypothetical protein